MSNILRRENVHMINDQHSKRFCFESKTAADEPHHSRWDEWCEASGVRWVVGDRRGVWDDWCEMRDVSYICKMIPTYCPQNAVSLVQTYPLHWLMVDWTVSGWLLGRYVWYCRGLRFFRFNFLSSCCLLWPARSTEWFHGEDADWTKTPETGISHHPMERLRLCLCLVCDHVSDCSCFFFQSSRN